MQHSSGIHLVHQNHLYTNNIGTATVKSLCLYFNKFNVCEKSCTSKTNSQKIQMQHWRGGKVCGCYRNTKLHLLMIVGKMQFKTLHKLIFGLATIVTMLDSKFSVATVNPIILNFFNLCFLHHLKSFLLNAPIEPNNKTDCTVVQ